MVSSLQILTLFRQMYYHIFLYHTSNRKARAAEFERTPGFYAKSKHQHNDGDGHSEILIRKRNANQNYLILRSVMLQWV